MAIPPMAHTLALPYVLVVYPDPPPPPRAIRDTDPKIEELPPLPPILAGALEGIPPLPTVMVCVPEMVTPVTTLTSPPPPPPVDPAPPPPTNKMSAVTWLGNVIEEVPTVVNAYTAYAPSSF